LYSGEVTVCGRPGQWNLMISRFVTTPGEDSSPPGAL
jgi:hypothetical protein